MALNKNKNLKMFYSIAEVAEMFDVNPTLLRFWEKYFPQIIPKRAGRKVRQYTDEDIQQIRIVHNLVKVRGLKLEAAASLIRKNKEGVERKSEVIALLTEIRSELVEIKRLIDGLE